MGMYFLNHLRNVMVTARNSYKQVARRLAGGRAGRLAACARTRQMIEALAQMSASLQEEFLRTGETLIELNSRASDFLKTTGRLRDIACGQLGGQQIMANSMKTVERPLHFLEAYRTETDQILRRLIQNSSRIHDLLAVDEQLHQTMKPLKFLQTLFKIEAAPLGADVERTFTALTDEIDRLNEQVYGLFGTKFQYLRCVGQTIDVVIEQLRIHEKALGDVTSALQQKIQSTIGDLDRQLINNQRRESQVNRLSHAVAAEVQNIVKGLQFQDIVQQRLQHTVAAVSCIDAQLSSEKPAWGFVDTAIRVELSQLEAIDQDIKNAQETVESGINNVIKKLKSEGNECLLLREFKQVTVSCTGMVQTLLETVDLVQGQVAQAVADSSKALYAIEKIGNVATDLTGVVREISYRTQLIGLNAQVQAARVEHGDGLQVLSAYTSEISGQIAGISQKVAAELDQLANDLTLSISALQQLSRGGLEQQTRLSVEQAAHQTELHQLRDHALQLLEEGGAMFEKIETHAGRSLLTVDYSAISAQVLAAMRQQLKALAEHLPTGPQSKTENDKAQINALYARYTMISERQVFERVVGSSPDTDREPLPNAQAEEHHARGETEAKSGMQFKENGEARAEADDCTLSDNNSTFSSETASSDRPELCAVVAGTSGTKNFGDNVELF